MKTKWLFLTLLILTQNVAYAEEQRCNELGTKCVCSEPLNTFTNTFSSGNTQNWNPNDSSSKECNRNAQPWGGGSANFWESYAISRVTDAAILNRMPNHTAALTGVMMPGANQAGINNGGAAFSGSLSNIKRIVSRAYFYTSGPNDSVAGGDFEWNGEGGCQQATKWWSGDTGNGASNFDWGQNYWSVDSAGPGWWGGALGTVQGGSCGLKVQGAQVLCQDYNGLNIDLSNSSLWPARWPNGNWIREEVVIDNPASTGASGTGARIRIYWKNITKGQPERKILDTYSNANCSACPPNQNVSTTSGTINVYGKTTLARVSPPFRFAINWDAYRQNGGGQCNGSRMFSHFMSAEWTTTEMAGYDVFNDADTAEDAQYRIGSALEVEGCAGEINPGTSCGGGAGVRPLPPALQVN